MRKLSENWTNKRRQGAFFPCHLVTLSPCLLVFLLAGVWKEEPNAEKLMSEGHAAFARGDYAGAAGLYEQAEIYSTDPRRVAFYLAGAKYHLALKTEGPSPELQEAEQLYRCCLDPADPRRSLALYGLGNCLLHKAGERDAASLRGAIACYDQCLQSAGDDTALAADARYNRERARLLLLQFLPPINAPQSDRPPNEDRMNPYPFPHNRQPLPVPIGEQGPDGGSDAQGMPGAVKPEPGTAAAKSNDPPPPGKGNLEPIPDQVDVPPLSPHDAAEHLELASKKVMQERQTHHRRTERPSATGVKDW
jgi:tetratricopeptide (TPR) repeat protein